MAPLLTLENFQVRYGAVDAVRGIDLEVGRGEVVALLGANGAGKSSTLNAVAGLVPRRGGRALFEGADITGRPAETMPVAGLTLVPEGRRVFGTLTVADNLAMGAYVLADQAAIAAGWNGSSSCFRSCRSGGGSLPEPCRAGSSRCWPSAGP